MIIGLFHYIALSSILFLIGVFGIFTSRKSVLSLIMAIEIILLSININFIAFANYWNDFVGQIFVLFILSISAAEIAIVLVALVIHFNNRSNIWIDDLNTLRG